MRAGIVAWVIGLALLVSGCDPVLDRRYVNEGAGVDLYTADRASQIELLRAYENFICAQIGGCGNDWGTFVLAGMNDIDQRCDGFLTWLDARRRDKEPILAEISAINTAIHSIMTVTGSSPKSLDIVTMAFGLASATYANWNSRLLISANQSTVQEIVYKGQGDFRERVKTYRVPDQPTAIYLLRNYLRLCMPITIEASINTTTTLVLRDSPTAARKNLVVSTMPPSGGTPGPRAEPAQRADKPIEVTPPPKRQSPGALTPLEKTMGLDQSRTIQRILCVDDTGDFGPDGSVTRKSLIDFMAARGAKSSGRIETPGELVILTDAVKVVQSCSMEKLDNAFEFGILSVLGEQSFRARIKRAIDSANKRIANAAEKITAPPELVNPASNAPVGDTIRASIKALRTAYAGLGIPAGSSIDQQLWKQITKDGLVQ